MAHWLLSYDLAADYLARRPQFRALHLLHADAAVARGELVLGGALHPAEQAMLLFSGETAEVAEAFAAADPYVLNGLVTQWRVRRWLTVAGPTAAEVVQPNG